MKKWVYSKPVIQIVLCMAMIATAIRRDAIFPIKNTTIKLITDVMFGTLTIFSVIRLVLAFDSLYNVYEYRKNTGDVKQKKQSCLYKLEDMIKTIEENDIIEIEVAAGTQSMYIGSSSNLEPGSNKFYEKIYYIGDDEYIAAGPFKSALLKLFPDQIICVKSIDHLSPEDMSIHLNHIEHKS